MLWPRRLLPSGSRSSSWIMITEVSGGGESKFKLFFIHLTFCFCFYSVSISLVLVPPVCCGAFQGDQASRASPATACRVPCLLDSPMWCGALVLIRIGVKSGGFLSQVRPSEAALLCRGGWPWCSCYHGGKAVRCSCINLHSPESWLRSSGKGKTANLRPSPQKGLRSTHSWETSVRNQVKGPGHSQKRNLGV